MVCKNISKTKFTFSNRLSKPVTISLNTLEIRLTKYLKEEYDYPACAELTELGYRVVVKYFLAKIKLTHQLKDFNTIVEVLKPTFVKFTKTKKQ